MCTCRDCLSGVNYASLSEDVSNVPFNVSTRGQVSKVSVQGVSFATRCNFGVSLSTNGIGTFIRVFLCLKVDFRMTIC